MTDDVELNKIIINGIFTLGGVFLGLLFPLIKDLISNKAILKIERIKLHDSNKIEAYKKAYHLTDKLKIVTWESDQKIDITFLNTCGKELFEIISDMPYFSKVIRNDLLEIESLFDEVIIDFKKTDKNCELIEKRIPELFIKLRTHLLTEFSKWEM